MIENYQPKGDIEGLPIEIIKQMLIEQVAQGNKEDISLILPLNHPRRKLIQEEINKLTIQIKELEND